METLQRTANRGSVATGGYEVANSCKFEPDNSEYLKWTNISTYATSARKKTFSFSVWFQFRFRFRCRFPCRFRVHFRFRCRCRCRYRFRL